MLDALRNTRTMAAATSAGIVIIATIIGGGVATADTKTEVKLQNKSGVTLEVTITDGDATLKKKGPIQSVAGNDARTIGTVPDGTTLKWEAKPKNDQDKDLLTACKGQKKVVGSTDTIVIEEKNCTKSSGTTAPKTGTSNKQTDDKKKADDKKPANSAGGALSKVTIKLENTMDDVVVSDVKIWDELDNPYSRTEISFVKPKELYEVKGDFTKDKSGKFDIIIAFSCLKDGDGKKQLYSGGLLKYKGSETTIHIVKTKPGDEKKNIPGECGLKP